MFRPQSIAHAVNGINAAPHGESRWNGIELSAAQIRSPEIF